MPEKDTVEKNGGMAYELLGYLKKNYRWLKKMAEPWFSYFYASKSLRRELE